MKLNILQNLALAVVVLRVAAFTNISYADEPLGIQTNAGISVQPLAACPSGASIYLVEGSSGCASGRKSVVLSNKSDGAEELPNFMRIRDSEWAKNDSSRQSTGLGCLKPDQVACTALDTIFGGSRSRAMGSAIAIAHGYAARLCGVDRGSQFSLKLLVDLQSQCEKDLQAHQVTRDARLKKTRLTTQCQGLKEKFEALKEQDNAQAAIERANITAAADMYGCGNLGEAW